MAAVIIRKVDVERLGKELIKEVYEFLHDEYITSRFPEMKLLQNKFLKDVVYKSFRHYNVTKITTNTSLELKYKEFDDSKFEEELKCVIEQIKDGTMDIDVIFNVLLDLDLDMEIEEDLFFKQKSFLDIYRVFKNGYSYLEE